jgi:aryl-alcohol dehydrogenase-like predicted oxidoreductase
MNLRQLGDSDLRVSEIGLGSWLTYGGGVGDESARECVDAAFDAGIVCANASASGIQLDEQTLAEIDRAPSR